MDLEQRLRRLESRIQQDMDLVNGCLDGGGMSAWEWEQARQMPAGELTDDDLVELMVALRRREEGIDLIEDDAVIDRSLVAHRELRELTVAMRNDAHRPPSG